jgi:hypothetical protein
MCVKVLMTEYLHLTECSKIFHEHHGAIGYSKLLLPSHVTASLASYKTAFSFLTTRVYLAISNIHKV